MADQPTYEELQAANQRLQAEVSVLLARIKELESRLNQHSGNSSLPPSRDKVKQVRKNNREKSGKSAGAQQGHKGKTLEMVGPQQVSAIEVHRVSGLCSCGADLADSGQSLGYYHRQVIDLPAFTLQVIEHQIEVKACSCGKKHQASCRWQAPVQYGLQVKALLSYLQHQHYLPFGRLQQLMADIFGVQVSDGLIGQSSWQVYQGIGEDWEQALKEELLKAPCLHNDETGIRCEQKNQWVHVSSTSKLTHYGFDSKRGKQAMDTIGILPFYQGVSVHDRYSSYFQYSQCSHALCNAHLLRELTYLAEELQVGWAVSMKSLLQNAYRGAVTEVENAYQHILTEALAQEPPLVRIHAKGKIKKSTSRLLLEAFLKYKEEILRFFFDPDVPFDNNQAERDLRMIKLKAKISGCFRTATGAKIFCRIRSYLSTVSKQGDNLLLAIKNALEGKPRYYYAEQ